MIFPAADDATEPRATALYAAAASVSATNSWTSVNGWAAARVYSSFEEEYEAASRDVALVDLGPLCRYTVRGKEAPSFLSRLTSCPVTELSAAESGRGLILNADGLVVDLADMTRVSGDLFLLTTSAPIDRRLQVAARGFDVEVENIAGMVAALGLFGPNARDAAAAAGVDVLEAEATAQGRVRGVELAVRPINLGSAPGIEIIFPAEDALVIWERLRRRKPIPAMGLDAADALRIEGGAPRLGVDFIGADAALSAEEARIPDEIGLPHLAPPNRAWFNGRRAMRNAERARRRLVVLSLDCDRAPVGAAIRSRDAVIGGVTSAAFSPKLKRVLCFAEVRADAPASELEAMLTPDGRSKAVARLHETDESRLAATFRENLKAATGFRRSPV